MAFTHVHVHTEYSLLDGMCRIGEVLQKAKDMGMTSLAITDHGALYGAFKFYIKAKDLGIKPIISPELSRRYKQAQDVKNHLNDLSNNAALDVCHFGGKLPGVHTLYTLSYDVLDNRFNVGFIIRTRANDETKFFYAQGDFDTLRYKIDELLLYGFLELILFHLFYMYQKGKKEGCL